jgi:voltage-gated potassium channel
LRKEPEAMGMRQWGPYGALLVALLIVISVVPFLPGGGDHGWLSRVGYTGLVIAAISIAHRSRLLLWSAAAIALPGLVSRWQYLLGDAAGPPVFSPLLAFAFLLFTAILIVRQIFASRGITFDQLLGGINAYLLLGVAFAHLHSAVEVAAPGSYMLSEGAVSELFEGSGTLDQTFVYFSFTTFTTLGYGDIRPVGQLARILCSFEAVVGQLFVAVLIARIVSEYARAARDEA